MNWKRAWSLSRFCLQFVIAAALVAVMAVCMSQFLNYVEERAGVHLPDPLLALFEPKELTWLTFVILYGAAIVAVLRFSRSPLLFLDGLQAYATLLGIRIIMMYFTPLVAPPTTLSLADPFVELLMGSEATLQNDLFFSGHTSLLFLLFLLADSRATKYFFLVACFALAACVLLQHVHYTVDVLVAPLAAYAAYRVTILFNKSVRVENGECKMDN